MGVVPVTEMVREHQDPAHAEVSVGADVIVGAVTVALLAPAIAFLTAVSRGCFTVAEGK
jgi:hypothetical protein